MSTKSPLSNLPKLPALDSATQDLFSSIMTKSETKALAALQAGANPNAILPYYEGLEPDEINGGNTPLQEVCTVYPQTRMSIPVLETLLNNGADPSFQGELRQDVLSVICERMPNNSAQAIQVLATHGVIPQLSHLRLVLGARQAWPQDIKVLPLGEIGVLDALWDHLPEEQRKKIDASWLMSAVPNHTEALSYAQVKMVQWVSNKCPPAPVLSLQERVSSRRETDRAPAQPALSSKLH